MVSIPTSRAGASRWPRKPSASQQVLLALVIGCLGGWWLHRLSPAARAVPVECLALCRDLFLRLIKTLIGPLVFGSLVVGIAQGGDSKKAGRIGLKTLVYFEVVTTLALAVGLGAALLLHPGAGVKLIETPVTGGSSLPGTVRWSDTVLHIVPTSLVDALARNDVLQVVAFALIFALAVIAAGKRAEPILTWCVSLTHVMFSFARIVIQLAPVGAGAAMAVTLAEQGPTVLLSLGRVMATLYLALAAFVLVVLGAIGWMAKVPLLPFLRAVREPFLIAFATASSEAALPKALDTMEQFGVERSIVGLVLPAGYSFNLDGSALYLAVASVFVAQAAEFSLGLHFPIGQQLLLLLTLMVTSKGIAAVPRASLVVLMATLSAFHLPIEGAVMLLAVDALLDMGRTAVNVLGNCMACVVVGRWEGGFDPKQARRNFGPRMAVTEPGVKLGG